MIDLTLSSIKLLAPHVDKPEGPELLQEARGKSKREVERLVACQFPEADRPRGPSPRIRAIDGERYKLEVTVDAEFVALLQRAVDLDRHRNPEGDRAKILREGLELQVAHQWVPREVPPPAGLIHLTAAEKRKYKVTDRPREPRPDETKSVPAEARRQVHERDQGRCTFVGKDGRPCGATAFIEYDHVTPRAKSGNNAAQNGRETCGAHNRRSAELALGKEQVERAREREARRRDAQAALRTSGFSTKQARDAVAHAESRLPPEAPLEELLRRAFAHLGSGIAADKGRSASRGYKTKPPPRTGGCSEMRHLYRPAPEHVT